MTKVYRQSRTGMLVPAEDFTVENIELAQDGTPCAIISVDGDLVEVTRRFGSWGTVPDDSGQWRTVLPEYAAALQLAAREVER